MLGVSLSLWRSDALSPAAPWYSAYDLASGNPTIVMDFVGNRYRAGGTDVTLASLVNNPTTLNANGMPLTALNITAAGALLSTMLGSACTVVAEVSGMSNGPNLAIIGWGSTVDFPMIGGLTGSSSKLRSRSSNVTVNSPNQVDWTQTVKAGVAYDGSGSIACANGLWGTVTNANALLTAATVYLGSFQGSSMLNGGNLRRLVVWPRKLNAADLMLVTTNPFAPLKGTASALIRSGQKILLNSAGKAALNWDRTQAWSVLFAIRKATVPGDGAHPGSDAHVIFSNVAAPGTSYRGWEAYFDVSGRVVIRIMSAAFGTSVGTNYLERRSTNNICDDKVHIVCITYDGSSTAAGVKVYVDGVAETMTTARDTLTGTLVNSPVNDFWIGNQITFDTIYMLEAALDHFMVYDRALSGAEVAARSTVATLPGVEANVVLRLAMDEGTGTTVADSSGNGYDGTLTSSTQWVAA